MKLPKHKNILIYIISLLLPFVLAAILFVLYFIAIALSGSANEEAKMNYLMLLYSFMWIIFLISILVFIVIPQVTYTVLYLIQIFQMWKVINDGHSRATPGQALGFLFIPFYNIYWIFNVWGGFPTDYNAFVNRYRLNEKVPLLDPTIYQVFPVIILLSGLIITIPVLLIYFGFVLNSSNKAIDNLRSAINESQLQFSRQPAPNMAFQPQS